MHRFNAGAAPQKRVQAERKNARMVPEIEDRVSNLEKFLEFDSNGDIMLAETDTHENG